MKKEDVYKKIDNILKKFEKMSALRLKTISR